jgi:hypothetical protein
MTLYQHILTCHLLFRSIKSLPIAHLQNFLLALELIDYFWDIFVDEFFVVVLQVFEEFGRLANFFV